ncbi:MAG TPA: transposase [Acidimicrobiales bacterium]|nr:transposase [Acidimicrobiales bacterium]
MANSYIRADRDQGLLLPTSMRDWLHEGHLAWFVLDVVDQLDTSAFHSRHPGGAGRPAYDPDMLLTLLLYSYCNKVRSSRRIEALCEVDVAYRVICATLVPDHGTIARFRAANESAIEATFAEVLRLCAVAGLATLGTIAIDGTKMEANASMKANRGSDAMRAEVAAILAEAAAVDAAEDALWGDARGDELPPELADPTTRKERLRTALAHLDQMDGQARAKQRAKVAKAAAEAAAGRKARGRKPKADPGNALLCVATDLAVTRTRAQTNAEHRSRRQADAAAAGNKLPGRKPRDPGAALARAEADLVAARNRLVIKATARADKEAARGRRLTGPEPKWIDAVADQWTTEVVVSTAAIDHDEAVVGATQRLEAARVAAANAPPPKKLVANVTDPDSRIMKTPKGFAQAYNAQAAVNENQVVIACAVTQEANDCRQLVPMMAATATAIAAAGIDAEVGTVLADAGYWSEANATAEGPTRLIATMKDWKQRKAARELGQTTGPPPDGASALDAMEHRLRTPEGAATYAKRSTTVEPVFGDHKENRGYRRFMRRGLSAVQSEWALINTSHNLMKLYRQQLPGAIPAVPTTG